MNEIKTLKDNEVFVFGSNLAGRHGRGAALTARLLFGAKNGVGEGLQGSSYGIPTKGYKLETLPLRDIKKHVDKFLEFAKENPELKFTVTKIGCGLAGHQVKEIAPLFCQYVPDNVYLPIEFVTYLQGEFCERFTDTSIK